MRTNYVLIDYENVQTKNLSLLDRDEFKIKVFVGAAQKSVHRELAIALQRFGPEKAEYIEISGSGKNALDFHIAFYIGLISAGEPDAFFHIISRDTGFDPLITHLKARKVFCQRSAAIEDIPILRTLTAASTPDQADAVIANLLSRGASRPRTPKTLKSTVAALFGKKLSEEEVDALVSELRRRKAVKVEGNKIVYSLPG